MKAGPDSFDIAENESRSVKHENDTRLDALCTVEN
jgi:hypothetical protein